MKKTELKEFIKNEILNELSSTVEDTQQDIQDTKDLTKATRELGKAKEEAGLNENSKDPQYMKGYGDGYIDGYSDGEQGNEKAVELNENVNPEVTKMVNRFVGGIAKKYDYDTQSAVNAIMMVLRSQDWEGVNEGESWEDQGFDSEDDMENYYLDLDSVDESEDLNEMAKIAGDLKSAIEKVIADNPDLETLPLKKAIKADNAVKTALGDSSLYDNQLGKFISAVKGDREIGKRGRKADPNRVAKPKSSTGRVGRPAKSKEEKEKENRTTSSKLSKSVTTVKGDEPSAKDIKQAMGYIKKGKKDLQAQEKRKMIKSFVNDMKKEGVISPNGKVEDKEKYDAAWNIAKAEIEAAVKNIK